MNDKKDKTIIKTAITSSEIVLSGLSILNPALALTVPVCSVVKELVGYFDNKSTEKRLKTLQDKIEENGIEIRNFSDKLNSLNEHQAYVVRNNLKFLCVSAIPETVNEFNQAFINYVMHEEQSIYEELCEIIRQLNANDINCLKKIKTILENKELCMKRYQEAIDKINNNDKEGIGCRVYFDPTKTILWRDFSSEKKYGKISYKTDSGGTLVGNGVNNGAFFVRSILKLQNLGIVDTENILLFGDSSPANCIYQFSITVFGEELLKYI